eukprot:5547182-Prymnesium_polylepis.2
MRERELFRPAGCTAHLHLGDEAIVQDLVDAQSRHDGWSLLEECEQLLLTADEHGLAVWRRLASKHEWHLVCVRSKHGSHGASELAHGASREDGSVRIILHVTPERRPKLFVESCAPAMDDCSGAVLARPHKVCIRLCGQVRGCRLCRHRLWHRERDQRAFFHLEVPWRADEPVQQLLASRIYNVDLQASLCA